ncbi:MAG: hypothetical protein KatS3mg031_2742 [Chitinophagales bacterium]|nr:MAG: hypothetical protein KatS3mg031_2742 [Chitinophagales bacterium]
MLLKQSPVVYWVKVSVFTLCLIAVSRSSLGQRSKLVAGTDEEKLLYTREWSIGGRLLSNGWEIFGETAKIKNIYKTRVIQFGFSQIRHWKEKKRDPVQQFRVSRAQKGFFYGLQNQFFTLRGGYGFRKNIADKAERNGVRLALTYMGGISIGMLKPYYLELAYRDANNENVPVIVSQRYSSENHAKFLQVDSIVGASGFGKGITEIEFVPGIYGKFGLNFDWASREKMVKALEAGIMIDLYYKNIPLMVTKNNRFYFIAAYIGFQMGGRLLK